MKKKVYGYFECDCVIPKFNTVRPAPSADTCMECPKCGDSVFPLRQATKKEIEYQICKNMGFDCKQMGGFMKIISKKERKEIIQRAKEWFASLESSKAVKKSSDRAQKVTEELKKARIVTQEQMQRRFTI